mgnify:CR=1 FL=1
MKTLPSILFLLSSLLFMGCGTVAALKQPFTRSTNAVPVVVTVPGSTNVVTREVPTVTNSVSQSDGTIAVTVTPGYTTNFVTITPPRSVTNYLTNVVVSVNPALESALNTVQTVNQFNPTPSAPFINVAMTALLGGLGWFARMKTRQAQAATDSSEQHQSYARLMALAIEESKSAETKASVAKLSAAVGNAPELHAFVQGLTDRFKPKPA